jgi:hypothetical protein
MEDDSVERILRVIDERFVRLRRELIGLVPRLPGGGAAECGCLLDHGCCNDKGCCQDKGCCKQASPEKYWDDFVDFADRLGIAVEDLVARVQALDPKLLKARS